jgi:hypothetical protein
MEMKLVELFICVNYAVGMSALLFLFVIMTLVELLQRL